jgi:Concanavalin A-like lectin/glucanases superfamily
MALMRFWPFVPVVGLCLVGCTADPIDAVTLSPKGRPNGMVAHWPFDGDTTGITDRSRNGRNGTMTGGAIAPDGRFGDALHLESGEYVTVDPFPAEATPSWTVAGWIRIPNAPDPAVTAIETVVSTEKLFEGGWELNLLADAAGPRIEFAYWVGLPSGVTDPAYGYIKPSCPCIVPAVWTHIAGVVDADQNKVSIYQNGALRVAVDMPRTIIPGNAFLYLGRWDNDLNRPLIAALDDIVIYNRALAPQEIVELYQQPVMDP